MKDLVIAFLLLVIMVLNFIDVLTDISLGVPTWHIIEESVIVLASAVGGFFLVFEIRRRTIRIAELKEHIQVSDQQIDLMSEEMKSARHSYGEIINKQFSDWKLTMSEKEVAMLLLKGLSLREISGLRDTKEKTVRQQASNIYSKANVEGRHELAAYFFEDFLVE